METVESYTPRYKVIKNFLARLGDEMTIKEGEVIELLSDDSEYNDGWYTGRNLNTGKVGLYPKVFTKLIVEKEANGELSSKPSLLRSRSRRTPQGSPVTPNMPNHSFFNTSNDGVNNFGANQHQQNNFESKSTIGTPGVGVNKYVNDIDRALKELNVNTETNNTTPPNNHFEFPTEQEDQNRSNALETFQTLSPLNRENVTMWTPAEVCRYFSTIVDSESAQKFILHKISGSILVELDLPYLKELEISSFGTRFQIYKEIEKLRKYADGSLKEDDLHDPNTHASNISASTALDSSSSIPKISHEEIGDITPKRFSFNQRPQSYIERTNHYSKTSNLSSTPPPVQLNSYNSIESVDEGFENNKINSLRGELNDNINTLQTPKIIESNEQFVSPRKAPLPPNYPSPVSNNPMKFGIRSPEKLDRVQIPKIMTHSRHSSIGNASSIYIDTAASPKVRGHSRNPSDASTRSQRRYSSIIFGNYRSKNEKEEEKDFLENSLLAEKPKQELKVNVDVDTSNTNIGGHNNANSSNRRSVSAKEFSQILKNKDLSKRVTSEIQPATTSSHTFGSQPSTNVSSPMISTPSSGNAQGKNSIFRSKVSRSSSKLQTSAFQEGIRNLTPDEAVRDADYSGWMFKRGNLSIGSWKHRFFTLHKTRLSYYVTTKDTKEKGLIDITSHRVLPATEAEDKLSAVYAASAGYGRYCFKILPPAPGSKQGLTFTQQKVHYFAVETKEEMRGWMSALMKATIELDDTVPVISSCVTPTIPLAKAQELMVVARENAKENFDNLTRMREEQKRLDELAVNATVDDDDYYENHMTSGINGSATPSSSEASSVVKKSGSLRDLSNTKTSSPLNTNFSLQHNGMSTPYLLASGLNSPNTTGSGSYFENSNHPASHSHSNVSALSNNNTTPNINTPARMASMKQIPIVTKLDEYDDFDEKRNSGNSTDGFNPPAKPAGLTKSNSFSRRMLSLRRVSKEKE